MEYLKYEKRNLKGDLMGGLVAGVVALPLALAFGVQSGLGATAGLYGAFIIGILAAIFGGTATQASGPTGPMTVVSATLVALVMERFTPTGNVLPIIFLTFFLGGIFQICFGLLKLGSYVKYFPYPVISGFMSGVGLIIILLQVFPFTGISSPKSTIAVITSFPLLFENINLSALGIGAITVFLYYLFPKVSKAIPSTLVALVGASLIAYFFKLNVPTIGNIPTGLPALQMGGFMNVPAEAYATILEYALILAALGSIDSLLTSVIADNITKTTHNSNRELIGQGVGNAIAGAFGGIPGAGATKGTVVNINSGGTTRLSGAVHGLFLLVVLVGAGGLAAFIPLPVLAGILIPVGINIIDFKGFKHLHIIPKSDAFVLITVLLITTFGNLIYAVAIGLVLACVLYMKKSADLAEQNTELTTFDKATEDLWPDELKHFSALKNQVYIKHLYGPLFFGSVSHFKSLISSLDQEIKTLIIRMDRVPYIDQSGLYAMESVIFELQKKSIPVLVVGLHRQPSEMLKTIKIIPNLINENQTFETIKECIDYLKKKV